MDENWATIAIEQPGLPIVGVLGNFLNPLYTNLISSMLLYQIEQFL